MRLRLRRFTELWFRMLSVSGLFVATLCAQPAVVVAHNAWIRLPAPMMRQAALYMLLENRGSRPRAVVSASSDTAQKIEMHEVKMIDAEFAVRPKSDLVTSHRMMVMTPVTRITIPGNGTATLNPQGLHMMLFGLKTKLTPGQRVTVTLRLEDGTPVLVTATVRNG